MKCVKQCSESFKSWEMHVIFVCSSTLQVFDSNINKDKLLRLKLGSGKVIKVNFWNFIIIKLSQIFELLKILIRVLICSFCFIWQETLMVTRSKCCVFLICTGQPGLLLSGNAGKLSCFENRMLPIFKSRCGVCLFCFIEVT